MDKYLNHYQQDFVVQSPIRGQEYLKDDFTLDYRNTRDPIHDHDSTTIMWLFAGEVFYNG